MQVSTIVCLDDLVRDDVWPASAFTFDLLRLPIFHATGIGVGKTPQRGQTSGLAPGFSVQQFRALCARDADSPQWHALHHRVPEAAADYLLRHLPTQAMVLGHEMPPWLTHLLDGIDLPWIDLRPSALRFGSDLYTGLRTNQPALHTALQPHALSADAVVNDAKLMAARLRLRRRGEAQLRLPRNPCVFVGQPEHDTALIEPAGRIARATDHAETLYQLARRGPLLYLAHPQAGEFARVEHEAIERITGHRVPMCTLDGYELLACDDELTLVGLTAGLLQEAVWFARPAYALGPVAGQAVFDAVHDPAGCLQIASHVLLGEALWAAAFDRPLRAQALQPAPRANLLRELRNDWWGYAESTLRGSEHLRAGFTLAGGDRQADALRRCEDQLADARDALHDLRAELDLLKARLGETAVIAARAAAASAALPADTAAPSLARAEQAALAA